MNIQTHPLVVGAFSASVALVFAALSGSIVRVAPFEIKSGESYVTGDEVAPGLGTFVIPLSITARTGFWMKLDAKIGQGEDKSPSGLYYQINTLQGDTANPAPQAFIECVKGVKIEEGWVHVPEGYTVTFCIRAHYSPRKAGLYFLHLNGLRISLSSNKEGLETYPLDISSYPTYVSASSLQQL